MIGSRERVLGFGPRRPLSNDPCRLVIDEISLVHQEVAGGEAVGRSRDPHALLLPWPWTLPFTPFSHPFTHLSRPHDGGVHMRIVSFP
jgi:hypothetical protein